MGPRTEPAHDACFWPLILSGHRWELSVRAQDARRGRTLSGRRGWREVVGLTQIHTALGEGAVVGLTRYTRLLARVQW